MKSIAALLLILLQQTCYCQKQSTTIQQIWLGNTSQIRFSERWGMSFDLQLRSRENFFKKVSQISSRIGAVYYPNETVRVSAGYYFADNVPRDYHNGVWQVEHTGWQQIAWSNKYSRLNINQSVRLEERFRHRVKNEFELGEGFGFNYRTRYNILTGVALGHSAFAPHTLSAVVYNEVYLNFGKQIIYNTFDQYRIFTGFNYFFSKKASLLFGHMYSFQQLSVGKSYRNLHAARIFYLYNFDLRKKKVEQSKPVHDVS